MAAYIEEEESYGDTHDPTDNHQNSQKKSGQVTDTMELRLEKAQKEVDELNLEFSNLKAQCEQYQEDQWKYPISESESDAKRLQNELGRLKKRLLKGSCLHEFELGWNLSDLKMVMNKVIIFQSQRDKRGKRGQAHAPTDNFQNSKGQRMQMTHTMMKMEANIMEEEQYDHGAIEDAQNTGRSRPIAHPLCSCGSSESSADDERKRKRETEEKKRDEVKKLFLMEDNIKSLRRRCAYRRSLIKSYQKTLKETEDEISLMEVGMLEDVRAIGRVVRGYVEKGNREIMKPKHRELIEMFSPEEEDKLCMRWRDKGAVVIEEKHGDDDNQH